MKPTVYLVSFFVTFRLFAQFSDNFSDGNFTQNPAWDGGVASFAISAQNQLQSNGPNATSIIYLATSNSLAQNAEWNFWVKLNFNPTSSNYTRIYLVSDQANLNGSLNGYYIRIGEDGSADAVDLYRQSGTTNTRILRGVTGRVATAPTVRIKVTLDFEGNWSVFSDNTGGSNFVPEGMVNDNTFSASGFSGVWCSFTATNRAGFTFDDFEIKTANFVPPAVADYKDLIINELLPDETPSVGLPEAEFVEIFNRSSKNLNLNGFTLSSSSNKGTFPNYLLKSGEYLILSRTTDTLAFKPFGKTLGVPSFPSLTNAGTELTLQSRTGKLIDRIKYNIGWYRDSKKTDGGWTLELIDPDNTCSEEFNWTASVNSAGGTPGKTNSVKTTNPDLSPPQLINVNVDNSRKITILFNKKLDSLSVLVPNIFSINPTIPISSVKALHPDYKTVELSFASDLSQRTIYTLTIQNVKDVCQNILINPAKIPFTLPEQGDSSDVVLNEVLFNPRPNSVDFVEIYNRSEKYINLKNWQLGRVDDQGNLDDTLTIALQNSVMLPKSYLVITADGSLLRTNYPKGKEENFVVTKTPAYNDDEGTVLLFNNQRKLMDKFAYDEKFHFKLLDDKEGVSLERISTEKPGNTPDNWHSAAGTEGYATPGYRNSQSFSPENTNSTFSIDPKVFAPDDDGYKDFTTFNYVFNNIGNVANIKIFDANGRLVKDLVKNQSLSTAGSFQWDGTNDKNEKVRVGTYLVFVQIFEFGGQTRTFKETVAVAAKIR